MASPISRCRVTSCLAATLLVAWAAVAVPADPYDAPRRHMVREIAEMAEETAIETDRPRLDARVMQAMGRVPRQLFVRPGDLSEAYDNRPLPIGHGQTISQPYIVALMSDLLRLKPGQRVLEIGTGSGYQAAVLADLGARVHSIEIIEPLGRRAAENLQVGGYGQVRLRVGDGYHGWPEAAPFDGILVTAAASHVPPPLVKQLRPGGRMVIPVGGAFLTQYLLLVEKQADGAVTTRQILPVRFVPLTGGH
ncbi:MAG: protein-L-isoaspartate(D-aspartate) O-methyltransferase [Thiobacillaceae bacterium]|jgi:protein-L-isoaspartate(D-aspartate) O-methyltransferase|nr:protein-L-isoaspartate(D-aspartate) O-methyltransferase [Thiobacillaceae bacterium]